MGRALFPEELFPNNGSYHCCNGHGNQRWHRPCKRYHRSGIFSKRILPLDIHQRILQESGCPRGTVGDDVSSVAGQRYCYYHCEQQQQQHRPHYFGMAPSPHRVRKTGHPGLWKSLRQHSLWQERRVPKPELPESSKHATTTSSSARRSVFRMPINPPAKNLESLQARPEQGPRKLRLCPFWPHKERAAFSADFCQTSLQQAPEKRGKTVIGIAKPAITTRNHHSQSPLAVSRT
mmetsp:Transcript_108067/g.220653  ORF Transcript_108067/g.220653 Transcript_108067/m.220653 type:complete len:234 (-) Transcript_108067:1653-2354(-)